MANKPKVQTPKQYAESGGCKCPICGDNRVEGGPVTVTSGGAHQEVTCTECDATWTDMYRLSGYAYLKQP